MNINLDICDIINKNNVDQLLHDNTSSKNKIKLLKTHKIEANDIFGKVGDLPHEASLKIKTIDDLDNKVAVMDFLGGDYNGDMPYDFHRPCNCTKSYCLKLYCECFARDKLCVNCNCTNCMNNLSHEKSRSTALLRILDKNPLAFLPKIDSGQGQKLHRKGCNCKRSECLKNYCECREAKIECSSLCRCQGCKNRSCELSAHSSQAPCSLDLTVIEPDGFKSSNILFKSNNNILNEKPQEDNVNLHYPFIPMYDESNSKQTNVYCNGAPIPEFSSGLTYTTPVNSLEDVVKYNEYYKKMNHNFYKQNLSNPRSETHFNNSKKKYVNQQSKYLNWNPFLNINNEHIDYKEIPYNSHYPSINFNKFPNSQIMQQPRLISSAVKSSDMDYTCNQNIPGSSIQYLNDADDYLELSSRNNYKKYNTTPNLKRFHDVTQYHYPSRIDDQQFDVQPSEKDDQDDQGEVTSTNELEMMVSSNCDGLVQHQHLPENSMMKPSSCESHSPLSTVQSNNFNCYQFGSDSMLQNIPNSDSKPHSQTKYPSQSINGHILPSLFNNICETNDLVANDSFYHSMNESLDISDDFQSPIIKQRRLNDSETSNRYQNYGTQSNSNFFNFYGEPHLPFVGNTGPMYSEELLNKSEPMLNNSLDHINVYPDHFNHFYYTRNNNHNPKVVTTNVKMHK